jgi:hypothetical protein
MIVMMVITKVLKKTTGEDNEKTEMYQDHPFRNNILLELC